MNTKNYVEAWYEVVMNLIDLYRQYAGLNEQPRKLLFLITPSIDTSVGAHLDIDVFTIVSGKCLKNSHATILSDMCGTTDTLDERVNYVKALADHGDQLFLYYGPFECVIQLERSITKTDSAKLGSIIDPPVLFGSRLISTRPISRTIESSTLGIMDRPISIESLLAIVVADPSTKHF